MKMKLFISLPLCLFFWMSTSQAQSWSQAIRFGDAEQETPLKMAVDANDNMYVLGYYESNSLSFDANTTLSRGSSTEQDYFLAKYDASLQFQWAKNFGPGAKRFGSGALSFAVDLALAPNGDPIVAVNLTGDTVDVAGTQVSFNDVMFEDWVRAGVIRLDAMTGNVIWSRFPEQYGAADPINGPYFTSVAVNDQSEVFVGGTVSDAGITIDTSSVSLPIGTTNNTQVFAFSLDGSGRSRWASLIYHNDGSNDLFVSGYPQQMAAGADGGVYLGWYDSDGRGNASATNDGHHLQKLNPADGSREWSKYFSTLAGAGDRWMGLHPLPDSSVMTLFTFREVVDLGGGFATPDDENEPGVLARFAADGSPLALKQMKDLVNGTYFSGGNLLLNPLAMSSVNSQGHFLVTGSFYSDLPLANGTTLIGEKLNGVLSTEDVLVLELDEDLNIYGYLQAGSNNRDEGLGIEWSSTGTTLVTGDFLLSPSPFSGSLSFDAIQLTSVGRHDVFIAEGTPGLGAAMSLEGSLGNQGLIWQQQGSSLLLKAQDAPLTHLQVFNLQGQLLGTVVERLQPGQEARWPVNDLKGIYLLTAERNGKLISQKLNLR